MGNFYIGKENITSKTMKTAVEFWNGHQMPINGYGMWQSDTPKQLDDALDAALEAGYRHFDGAYGYQNEDVLGRVLKRWFESGKVKREEIFITTKLPPQGNHHDRAAKFLQQSLDRLQLEYVDLFLVHNPASLVVDAEGTGAKKDDQGRCIPDFTTSLEKVWKAMEALVEAGKTKSIGLSSYTIGQVERILKCAKIPPANIQVELNACYPKKQLREYCSRKGITVTAFAVFGSPGRKTYYLNQNDDAHLKLKIPDLLDSPVVMDVAQKHGKTTGQVLLRYFAQQGVVVLAKSVSADRIKSNYQIFDFELDAADMQKLDTLDTGKEGSWAFDWKFFRYPGIENHPEFQLTSHEE